jgi:hypothetical protein
MVDAEERKGERLTRTGPSELTMTTQYIEIACSRSNKRTRGFRVKLIGGSVVS